MNSTPDDEQKFLELVNENRDRVLRICRVYAWNAPDREDLYQEILCQIWRSLPALKEQRFANTWVYRVAINTAMSFVRKRASRSDCLVQFEHAALRRAIESRQETAEKPEDRIAELYTAIYKLNQIEKALVTLFLEDLSYEEMAEATGIKPNNIGVLLHRAKKKLSALITEEANK